MSSSRRDHVRHHPGLRRSCRSAWKQGRHREAGRSSLLGNVFGLVARRVAADRIAPGVRTCSAGRQNPSACRASIFAGQIFVRIGRNVSRASRSTYLESRGWAELSGRWSAPVLEPPRRRAIGAVSTWAWAETQGLGCVCGRPAAGSFRSGGGRRDRRG